MSAINRFKEYFGMTPVEAYDDDYLDDYDRPTRSEQPGADRRDEYGYHRHHDDPPAPRTRYPAVDRVDEYGRGGYSPVRGDRRDDDLPEEEQSPLPRRYSTDEPVGRESVRASTPPRGSSVLPPVTDDYTDGLVTTTETVVERPRSFGDGKGLGENVRAGRAVVLDLSGMAKDDARRMVDFAAGLVFGLDGRMQKVGDRERTFLLQPAGMDLTEAEIRDAVSDAFRR